MCACRKRSHVFSLTEIAFRCPHIPPLHIQHTPTSPLHIKHTHSHLPPSSHPTHTHTLLHNPHHRQLLSNLGVVPGGTLLHPQKLQSCQKNCAKHRKIIFSDQKGSHGNFLLWTALALLCFCASTVLSASHVTSESSSRLTLYFVSFYKPVLDVCKNPDLA